MDLLLVWPPESAQEGSRPRAAHDQRIQSTYLFGAVAPTAEPVQPSCYRPATVKPCSFISTRSPPRLHRAPMPFSSLTKPVGTAPRNSGYQPPSPSCRCRRAHPSSTAKRTYGSSWPELTVKPKLQIV